MGDVLNNQQGNKFLNMYNYLVFCTYHADSFIPDARQVKNAGVGARSGFNRGKLAICYLDWKPDLLIALQSLNPPLPISTPDHTAIAFCSQCNI